MFPKMLNYSFSGKSFTLNDINYNNYDITVKTTSANTENKKQAEDSNNR